MTYRYVDMIEQNICLHMTSVYVFAGVVLYFLFLKQTPFEQSEFPKRFTTCNCIAEAISIFPIRMKGQISKNKWNIQMLKLCSKYKDCIFNLFLRIFSLFCRFVPDLNLSIYERM